MRADAVGPAAPNVDIRIADDGEVQFRSPGMFSGYYRQEEKTREAMTDDGFVKTGDAGFFDRDGQLKIIDRAKDVGRLAVGCAVCAEIHREHAEVLSRTSRRRSPSETGGTICAAFINIDLQAVGNWAERNNIAYASYQELASHPEVYRIIAGHVDETNRRLAREPLMAGAQVRRFLVLHKELDADDGELTRTLKVRRSFVADRYGPLIEALYDGSSECDVETEVTFEDGRKGTLRARVRIVEATTHPAAAEQTYREAAE